jgi:hypothetical protein
MSEYLAGPAHPFCSVFMLAVQLQRARRFRIDETTIFVPDDQVQTQSFVSYVDFFGRLLSDPLQFVDRQRAAHYFASMRDQIVNLIFDLFEIFVVTLENYK